MSDLDALLRAVLQFPDEDTPRLAYADEVQAQGDEDRAELIRVQVELARLDADRPGVVPMTPELLIFWGRRESLRRRVNYLFGLRSCITWRALPWGQAPRVAFRRGFVESVACTAAAWLEHGPAVCSRHPVTAVRLTDREPLRLPTHYEGRRVRDQQYWHWAPTVHWNGICLYGIPWEVWRNRRVPAGGVYHENESGVSFTCEQEAREWLSILFVNHARHNAGLDPLPEPAAVAT